MMKNYLSALLGATLISTAFSAGAAPSANVYSPYKGVLCDRKAGFCADEQGISMGLTKEYLGAEAEKKMVDLNANDVEAAMEMVVGSARSMGLNVVGA